MIPALGALITTGVVAVAIALLVHSQGNASETPTPPASLSAAPTMAQRIDGIPCNDQDIGYHVHAHLQIVYEGKELAVPASIGIHDNTCLYYLHTHDESGELHIEAPEYHRFTLGQFFDIWQQPLSTTRVATLHVPVGKTLRTFVDGKVFNGNPRSIQLVAHRLIALEIGPPFIRPSGFNFEGQ